MAPMKILISGGGIAGNSLAFWLSKLGHNVTVVERFPSLRATGLQIDLRGHGIEVMKRMGLEKAFRSKSAPEQGLQVVNKSGKRRAYFLANKSGKGTQSFTSDFEIMRGDFCRLIYDATKTRANFVFGTWIESFEENANSVEVRFSNGSTDRYDLLVGADGQGSRTRKMMLGPDAADGFYQLDGVFVAYFIIPRPIQEGEGYVATIYMATEGRGVMTRRHSPNEIQVYMGYRNDSKRLKDVPRGDEKKALLEIFKGAGWQSEDILESLDDATDFYHERMGIVKIDSWSHGRVVLVGDAAYCPSANTGMGITSAVVGAYVLAGEIRRHCESSGADGKGSNTKDDLATALKAYEQKFQPFMAQVQEGILEDSNWKIWSTPIGIGIMHCFLGVASLLRVNIGKWMLKEDVKGWELPDYEQIREDSGVDVNLV